MTAADTIRIEARHTDGRTEVRLLVRHPMDTGRERDPDTGTLIPAHYIVELVVEHIGADGTLRTLLHADFGPGVARHPFQHFAFRGGAPGDRVRVRWQDMLGDEAAAETRIVAGA